MNGRSDVYDGSPIVGSYSADLLGTIASNLAGLQGYDVMALELIQNADDAGASHLILDVTEDALIVHNDEVFTYCGDLSKPCSLATDVVGDACDFHRITKVASGDKARNPENIGRFGIGFISTYQICDHPEILSSGIRVTLVPEEGRVLIAPDATTEGTTFRLSWARNPNSLTRQKLRVSHVAEQDLQTIQSDISHVLDRALLFLRCVTRIELKRNGKTVRSCKLSRDNEGLVSLSFSPTKAEELWLVLTADAKPNVLPLYEQFPQLAQDGRRTQISVALPLARDTVDEGHFYAYLPTEQSTRLPLHVNADFYPEADRKNLILNGAKHQQSWNETLIFVAAECLAARLRSLRDALEPELIWSIIGNSWTLHRSAKSAWEKMFWDALSKVVDEDSELVWTEHKNWAAIGKSVFPPKNLTTKERSLLNRLQLVAASEQLRGSQPILEHLGCNQLTLRRLASALDQSKILAPTDANKKATAGDIADVLKPLWQLISELATGTDATGDVRSVFEKLPVILTTDNRLIPPGQAFRVESHLLRGVASTLTPSVAIADGTVAAHPCIWHALPKLTFQVVVDDLRAHVHSAADIETLLNDDRKSIHTLYRMLADLAGSEESTIQESCETLKNVPIFLGGKGFTVAAQVCLPGGFKDPLGFAELIPTEVTDSTIEAFFSEKLQIRSLDLRAYVTDVLPRFFADDPHHTHVNKLLRELATRGTTLDDMVVVNALANLPVIPTLDGEWHEPSKTYFRDERLVGILGDDQRYWVDESRLDPSASVRNLVKHLGIRKDPSPQHLAARILSLADGKATTQAQLSCEKAFYAACEYYEGWKTNDPAGAAAFVNAVAERECLPAIGDLDNWHSAEKLYAPYRREAFLSQAPILPFLSFVRLNTALLDRLGVKADPETALVVNHLLHCIESEAQPSKLVYVVLNERAEQDASEIQRLRGHACIYDEPNGRFVRPSQVFWNPPNLGRYALKLPPTLRAFQSLFDLLDVKDVPGAIAYLEILDDIISEYGDTGESLPPGDYDVYLACLGQLAAEIEIENEEVEAAVRSLRQRACIANLAHLLCYPDEIAVGDSDWHESQFGGELRGLITEYRQELQPIYRVVQVKPLSTAVVPEISHRANDEPLAAVTTVFRDRALLFARVLHDRPTKTIENIITLLTNIQVVRCDDLQVAFVCKLSEPFLRSPEKSVVAHYELTENVLYVTSETLEDVALEAFNSLLHVTATSVGAASIPSLVLSCQAVLLSRTMAVAERLLSAAGFPNRDAIQTKPRELDSADLLDLGVNEADLSPTSPPPPTQTGKAESEGVQAGGSSRSGTGSSSETTDTENGATSGEGTKRAEQRRDRLVSYVISRESGRISLPGDGTGSREHNLSIEDKGRRAAILWEQLRGRYAVPLSQNHPGWDIESVDPLTGRRRLIEVKSIDGEWTELGVGLSKLQFSEAWNYQNDYWLYVVEFAGEPERERVHAIQSPATQVTAFMFDRGWRHAASNESENPEAGYQPGVRIDCGLLGKGVICSIEVTEDGKVLIVDFGRDNVKAVSLNTRTMSVLPREDN